jgi:uncharacterized Zn finger protein
MGYHSWAYICPYCNFEEMNVCTDGYLHLEMSCPICGYVRWTEEKIPELHYVKLAKEKVAQMDAEEKQKAIDMYCEDNIPLVARSN